VDDPDAGDAHCDEAHLGYGIAQSRLPVQSGDEVRDRHIDHARRGEGEDLRDPFRNRREREIRGDASDDGGEPRDRVPEERLGAGKARVQEHQEIAQLLGNFVGDDRERRDDTQLGIREERAGDDHAVGEVVERIAEHDHPAHALAFVRVHVVGACPVVAMLFLFPVMMVPPDEQLLQHEEGEQPEEDEGRRARRVVRTFEELGDDVQERRAQHRAHGIAHECRDPARAHARRDRRGQCERGKRSDAACDGDIGERHAASRQMKAPMRPRSPPRR
jgi:hypothetical protein